jgi:hypothetical protein
MSDIINFLVAGAFFLMIFTGSLAVTALAITVVIELVQNMFKKK